MAKRRIALRILGWLAVGVHLVVVSFWAWWGTIENFHEGWYSASLWTNVAMLFGQYLSVPIVLTALMLVALWRPRIGLAAYLVTAVFAAWFFAGASFSVVYVWIVIPVAALGLALFFGRPEPKRLARWLVFAVPFLIVLAMGIPNALRVSERVDDGDYGMQTIPGHGVTLVWAPEGPGWPAEGGIDWDEAVRRCRHLSADGLTLEEQPQDVWRMPTVDELVRSQVHRGENAGGVWDEEAQRVRYAHAPDKETPLWRTRSPVIYLWSATETGPEKALIVVYHGGVFEKRKRNSGASFAFRAVRDP